MLALRCEEFAFQLTAYIGISESRPSSAVLKGTPCGGCLAAKTGRGEGRRQCQIAETYPVQV